MLPRQEAKVPSLGGELRFHTLHCMPKYKIKKKNGPGKSSVLSPESLGFF